MKYTSVNLTMAYNTTVTKLSILSHCQDYLKAFNSTNMIPDVTLAYDNMCNLDKLKASKELLPFDPPYDSVWSEVTKIIDVFHFSNHVSPHCKEKYSPKEIKQAHPIWNTQAGEQTLTWLSRFKHNTCSMPIARHHHLHRMVLRRNK